MEVALHFSNDTADYWRAMAQEAVAVAEEMSNPEARKAMLEIAVAYELLTKDAEVGHGRRI